VAANLFDGRQTHPLGQLRDALLLVEDLPVLSSDARERTSVVDVLTRTLGHTLDRTAGRAPAAR
jgi:signal recognition particle receptor subunit beta